VYCEHQSTRLIKSCTYFSVKYESNPLVRVALSVFLRFLQKTRRASLSLRRPRLGILALWQWHSGGREPRPGGGDSVVCLVCRRWKTCAPNQRSIRPPRRRWIMRHAIHLATLPGLRRRWYKIHYTQHTIRSRAVFFDNLPRNPPRHSSRHPIGRRNSFLR